MSHIKKLLFSVVFMNSVLFAGGKGVVPSESPIQSINIIQPSPYYLGLGFVRGHYDGCIYTGCKYVDVTFGTMARIGYEWNQYIGIEARVLGTFWGADPLGGQELAYGGLFTKPMYGFTEDFNVYGLLGYGWTKTRTGGNGNLQTVDEGGFSAGLGMEYDFSSKEEDKETNVDYTRTFDGQANQENGWGIFVDYQRLLIKSNTPKIDVISIGFTYDF